MKKLILAIFTLFAVSANATHLIVPANTTYMVGTSAPYNTLHGGDTLLLTSGTWGYIYLKNFRGTAIAPIVVTNYGGVVTCGRAFTYGIKIGGCRYIKFTGTGSADFYGFHVTHPAGAGLSVGDTSSDIETCNVRMDSCGLMGFVAKTDPACGGYAYRKNFTQYNTVIHDCMINVTVNEGMYIGNTHYTGWDQICSGNDSLLMPSLLDGVKVYNNIVDHAGWDGIQVSSALNSSIHDNLVMYDSQSSTASQRSGILIGGGTQGDCYDNYIENGNGDGIENFGLGNYKIYNNVIVNPGLNYYPGDQSYPCYGFYTNDIGVIQGNYYYFMFNTIINPKTSGIDFASQKATTSVIADNCIIHPGISGSYIVNNGYPSITITNNYGNASATPAMFTDTSYMTNTGSPLIDAGWSNTEGITLDKFGNARNQGNAPDIGVYENGTTAPVPPAQPGVIIGVTSQCSGMTGQSYSIASVSGATSYVWTAPTGWVIMSGQGSTSITANVGTSGNISVIATNSAGNSPARNLYATVTATPATPGAISGSSSQLPSAAANYSISAVTGATTYTWTVPTGWVINSGQGTINIRITAGTVAGQTGYITVKAGNSCGTSAANSKVVTVTGVVPSTPTQVAGDNYPCHNKIGVVYTTNTILYATSYTWTIPYGWSITNGQGTNTITVTVGNNGQNGNVTVKAVNAYGSSGTYSYSVRVNKCTCPCP
jgi:hypothetical protein